MPVSWKQSRMWRELSRRSRKLPTSSTVYKKYYNDERVAEKMSNANCRAFVEEFVADVMGSLSTAFSDKPWWEKVGWDGALLMPW